MSVGEAAEREPETIEERRERLLARDSTLRTRGVAKFGFRERLRFLVRGEIYFESLVPVDVVRGRVISGVGVTTISIRPPIVPAEASENAP